MAQWFVQRDDEAEILGPMTPSELLAMVRRGAIKRETKLRKDDSAWFPAIEVGGLFEAAVKPSIILHCPGCMAVIDEPPCCCRNCGREVEVARREIIENRILTPAEYARQNGVGSSMQGWLSRVKKKSK